MANQLLREGVWTSQRLASLSLQAHLAFAYLLPIADHWGRWEHDVRAIWRQVGSYRQDITPEMVETWLGELERGGLFQRYGDGKYAAWMNFKGMAKSQRTPSRYPDPPFDNSLPMSGPTPGVPVVIGPHVPIGVGLGGGVVEEKEQTPPTPPSGGEPPRKRRKARPTENHPMAAEVIEAYNESLGTRLGTTNGNLAAASRALEAGYPMNQIRAVFVAVAAGSTSTARWCRENNHALDYLLRPPYRNPKTGAQQLGPIDRVWNELEEARPREQPKSLERPFDEAAEAVWGPIRERLGENPEIDRHSWNTWIRSLRPVGCHEGLLELQAATPSAVSWIEGKHGAQIKAACEAEGLAVRLSPMRLSEPGRGGL
jgi:hypothetical protein